MQIVNSIKYVKDFFQNSGSALILGLSDFISVYDFLNFHFLNKGIRFSLIQGNFALGGVYIARVAAA